MRSTMIARSLREEFPISRNSEIWDGPVGHVPIDAPTTKDKQLVEAVAVGLRATGYPALRDIHIELCQGVVTLWGHVPSYYQKQLAQATAKRVAGVQGVSNGIEVISGR